MPDDENGNNNKKNSYIVRIETLIGVVVHKDNYFGFLSNSEGNFEIINYSSIISVQRNFSIVSEANWNEHWENKEVVFLAGKQKDNVENFVSNVVLLENRKEIKKDYIRRTNSDSKENPSEGAVITISFLRIVVDNDLLN